MKLNPWTPEDNPVRLKKLGKALEELGECTAALSRCLIQGIDGSEPVTGKPNRLWLEEEIADVAATLKHVMDEFNLREDFMQSRAEVKYERLSTWFDNLV